MIKKRLIVMTLSLSVMMKVIACPITAEEKMTGGQCVNVNGTELYINVTGKRKPTVLFITGLGDDTSVWKQVVPQVSQFARVITYDRAGLGKSEACTSCQTLSARDSMLMLHQLLQKTKIAPPYILVGHSIGGLYAQLFAQMYPKEITGVVLLDSSSRNETVFDHHPPKTAGYYKEAIAFNESRQQLKSVGYFPSVPLIILTATTHPGYESQEPLWQKWQSEFISLSPKSVQIIAWGSGHYIEKDQPQLVVDAIATIIQQ